MSFFSGRIVKVLSLGAVMVCSAYAATNPHVTVRPKARIAEKIDNTKVTAIKGSHPAKVASMNDLGRLDPGTPLPKMTLVLKSSDEQEYGLASLLDQQQKASHQNFHQWMTPDTFGATFGVESSDMAKVTGWLTSFGLTINQVGKGARIIQFSGTSGQVESAFHTEMHGYMVNGEKRISNATDISIPNALTPVVRGIARLNNFRPAPTTTTQLGVRDPDGTMHAAAPGGTNPLFTNPSTPVSGTASAHYIGGGDYAALYDTAPLLAKGINGTGVSIGLVESSDFNTSDVALYRSIFGLPVNQINVVHVGPDTGILTFDDVDIGNADVIGATDVEVAGAVAPMATLYYVVTGTTLPDFSAVDDSAVYLVENNLTDIIVMSSIADETDSAVDEYNGNGVTYPPDYDNGDVQFFQILWEQAAAQGQSVFVTAGDTGPSAYDVYYAGYEDGDTAPINSSTYGVNAYASTPFNVAVGSTEFNEGATYYSITGANPYWAAAATAPPYATALGYIPENTWNQGLAGTVNGATIPGAAGYYASGGGVSAYNQLPNWQSYPANTSLGIPGISLTTDPAVPTGFGAYPTGYLATTLGPHRLLPDVSMASGDGHDGTIICYEGSCTLTSAGLLNGFGLVSGTTASTASMAGIQALINQAEGGRQGNPNFYYYLIAKMQEPSAAICNASTYPQANTGNTAVCGFHDITVGTNQISTAKTGTASQIGWTATPGYDLTTGLGSPDAANLVALWPAAVATFQPTTVGFNIIDYNNPYSQYPIVISHTDDIQMNVNVYPVDSTGYPTQNPSLPTPSGDVGLIAVTTTQGGVGFYNISAGGCANYGGATVPITGYTVTQTGSASLGYLETITFTGNVGLGVVDEIGAGGYVLITGLTGQLSQLNNTYQYVTASTATTFQIQVGNPPVAVTLPLAVTPVTATVTAFSVTSNVVTFTAANTFTAGETVTFTGLTAFLNGTTAVVLSSGLSATQFQVALTTPNITINGIAGASASAVIGTGIPYIANFGTPLPSPASCGGYAGDGNVYDALNNGGFTQSGNFPGLPGGSYNIYAHYTGDTIYAGSNSQPIAVLVSPEQTTLETDAYSVTAADTVLGPGVGTASIPITYGQNLFLDTFVLNDSGLGVPTGTVTYTLKNGGTTLPTFTTALDTSDHASFIAGPGVEDFDFFFDTPSNYPVLSAGTYTINVAYSGDPGFLASSSDPFTVVVSPFALTTGSFTLTNETADIAPTGSATLLVSIKNAQAAIYANVPGTTLASGTMTFVDTTVAPNVTVGTCTVVAGTCTVTTTPGAISTVGAHTITANFTDTDGNYTSLAAAKTATVTVDAATATATTVSLGTPTPTGTASQVGATSTVVATVPTATSGTVALYANGSEVATGTVGTAHTVSITIPATWPAGTYALTATYGGTATLDASTTTTSVPFVQGQNTPIVTVSAAPSGDIGTGYPMQAKVTMSPNNQGKSALALPYPNMAMTFSEVTTAGNITNPSKTIALGGATAGVVPNGFAIIANATSSLLVPGPATIVATYLGDANYATTTGSESVFIGQTGTVVNVATASPTSGAGQITLQAVVTPTVPTTTAVGGTVSFYDNGTLLGSATAVKSTTTPLTITGVATLTVTLTSSSTHSITAVYSGDTHFYTSTATALTLTAPGFTLATNPTSLSIAQGSSGSVSVTATVFGNWSGQAPLVCTGLPANSYCTFSYNPNSPPSAGVPLSYFTFPGANGNYTGTLTITTLQPHAIKGVGASGLLWLPALMLAGWLGIRRKQLPVRGRQMLILAILLCGSLATTACSSLGMATPAGSSTVTVTANGVGTTSTQPTTTFTLTVTQ